MVDSLTAGGGGKDGTLRLLNATNEPLLDVQVAPTANPLVNRSQLQLGTKTAPGTLRLTNTTGKSSVRADAASGSLNLGGFGADGELSINDSGNDTSVFIKASSSGSTVHLGAANKPALISLRTGGNPGPMVELGGSRNALVFQKAGSNTQNIVEVNGGGFVRVGGFGTNGRLSLNAGDNDGSVEITTGSSGPKVSLGAANKPALIELRTGGNPGPMIELGGSRNALVFQKAGGHESIVEVNGSGFVQVGGSGVNGRVSVLGTGGAALAEVNGSGFVQVGGSGVNGRVSVLGADGAPLAEMLAFPTEAALGLGQANRPGRMSLFGAHGEAIRIDAATGDILLLNADIAEECDLATDDVEPGMVVVLTEDGSLAPCDAPYDHKVAGVISGAGTYAPALVLDRRPTGRSRAPIALMGKVYCWTDADAHPVAAGDLLTTAERPGHAMRVLDRGRALGAMLGKALAPLESGQGLVPVLVGLR